MVDQLSRINPKVSTRLRAVQIKNWAALSGKQGKVADLDAKQIWSQALLALGAAEAQPR